MPDYIYVLKPELLSNKKESTNEAFVTYYKEQKRQIEDGITFSDGLEQLKKDTDRHILINGEQQKPAEKESYEDFIKKQLALGDEDIVSIKNGYSQSLMAMIVHPMNFNIHVGLFKGRNFEGHERVDNVYREGDSVYFKTKIAGYKINTPETAYIQGPVEMLYKLEKDGFVLQHVATNSKFIQDAFLGRPISKAVLERD